MELNTIQETLNPNQNEVEQLFQHLSITNSSEFHDDDDNDNHVVNDSDEEEEEFSFIPLGVADTSSVEAEDAFSFMDGEIKPVFPLFNMDLMLSSQDFSIQPHAQRVFVEIAERSADQITSSTSGYDEISGPYCDLSNRKVVEVDPDADACKKSNSTGFSKIWRFKDFVGRSNSDGRDAFVFFNNGQPSPSVAEEVVPKEDKATVSVKAKKARKGKMASSSSPHEVYLRRKAKDEERKRPFYMPYRPELMGFFTNVNGGGLTRNVHPY